MYSDRCLNGGLKLIVVVRIVALFITLVAESHEPVSFGVLYPESPIPLN